MENPKLVSVIKPYTAHMHNSKYDWISGCYSFIYYRYILYVFISWDDLKL